MRRLVKTVGIGLIFVLTASIGYPDTFFTGLHGEKVTTEMELVTIDGATYFETKAQGVFLGSTGDLDALLTPAILKDASSRKPGKTEGVGATIKGHPLSGFRVTAGPKGMHVSIDLMSGDMQPGKGLLYDVLTLRRGVFFEEGEIKIPRIKSGKVVGFDIWTCAKGARLCVADQAGKLSASGVSHRYEPKEAGK